MDNIEALKILENNGFLHLNGSAESKKIHSALGSAAEPELINPKNEFDAKKNTLSSRFGLGDFPFHTDRAVELIPPRYVAIRFGGTRSNRVAFNLVDLKLFFKDSYDSGLFSFQNGHKSFIGQASKFNESDNSFRYNPVVMKPINKQAIQFEEMLHSYLSFSKIEKFYPSDGDEIIFDNYRFMHSRGAVLDDDNLHRHILRTYIYKD